MYSKLGGDVVRMTGLPEAVFAREAGMCYAGIAVVTNLGAGLSDSLVDHKDVVDRMSEKMEDVQSIILETLRTLPHDRLCNCCG